MNITFGKFFFVMLRSFILRTFASYHFRFLFAGTHKRLRNEYCVITIIAKSWFKKCCIEAKILCNNAGNQNNYSWNSHQMYPIGLPNGLYVLSCKIHWFLKCFFLDKKNTNSFIIGRIFASMQHKHDFAIIVTTNIHFLASCDIM